MVHRSSLWVCAVGAALFGSGTLANTIQGTVVINNQQGDRVAIHENLVVFIDGYESTEPPSLTPVVSHKGLQFSPRVLPILKGSRVDFLNDDGIYHNAFSLSKTKPFDLGIYPEGTSRGVAFESPGLVRVYCNIHPNMVSNILILNNPLFTTTNANGSYQIDNIPAGNYSLRVWSEFGADAKRAVTVQSNGMLEEHFTLSEDRRFTTHTNKYGRSYRSKY